MSARPILVINLGWEQEALIRTAKEFGHPVVGLHPDDSYARDLGLDYVEVIAPRNLDEVLAFAEKLQPAAVVSDQCDYSYFACTVIAEKLGLPGPRLREAQIATNKLLQRQRAQEAGLLQPAFQACTELAEAERFAERVGYPVILKPVDNRGSFGVNRADTREELRAAYYEALIHSHSRLVLVETFIHGVHITVDGYCFPESGHRSLSLATKTLIKDRQVAIDILYPGELSEPVYQRALENNDRVVAGLGYRFGYTHAEYMVDAQGDPYLIEIANRGGGCYTSSIIVPGVSGIDVTRQLVMDSLGLGEDLYRQKGGQDHRAAYLKFFVFPHGRIQRIQGQEEVLGLEGVAALRLRVGAGDEVLPTTTDADRHGFVITLGASRTEVQALAERSLQGLKVTYA